MNEELIRATVTKIRDAATLWQQDEFESVTDCGTSHCFAGWALVLAGFRYEYGDNRFGGFYRWADSGGNGLSMFHVFTEARLVLGLTLDQAEQIFYYFPDTFMSDAEPYRDPNTRQRMVDLMVKKVEDVTGLEGL